MSPLHRREAAPPPLVRVFPDNHEPQVLQVWAGLYDLAAAGRIRLDPDPTLSAPARTYFRDTLWAELLPSSDSRAIRICFDTSDSPEIASMDGLDLCDVYFKRTCSRAGSSALPPRLARRVLPYGLHHGCVSRHGPAIAPRLVREWRLGRAGHPTSLQNEPHALRRAFAQALAHTPVAGSGLCPVARSEVFEVPPDRPAERRVLLHTPLWTVEDAPGDFHEVNATRVRLVVELRRAFGARFVGGLADTPLARATHPELICPAGHGGGLRAVRRNRVAVATTGPYGSIPWSFAGYMAASRCIVAEPPGHQLPVPLEPGVHYVPAPTVDTCIAACERLLADDDLAREMRESAFRYYVEQVRPANLVWNRLQAALRHARSAAAAPDVRAGRHSG